MGLMLISFLRRKCGAEADIFKICFLNKWFFEYGETVRLTSMFHFVSEVLTFLQLKEKLVFWYFSIFSVVILNFLCL